MLCPHAMPGGVDNDDLIIKSSMISPPGTFSWVCSKCGMVTHDKSVVEAILQRYANNPSLLLKDEERFQKHARKYYQL